MDVRKLRPGRSGESAYFSQGFTLIELLVVIAIIAVLASLVLSAIFSAQTKARIALVKTQLDEIKAALQQFETETGAYPRRPGAPTAGTIFQNDVAWLYAALRNRAGAGGAGSRQIDWPSVQIGHAPSPDTSGFAYDSPWFGSVNGTKMAAIWGQPVDPSEYDLLNDFAFQKANGPLTKGALVFLDPWGNPLVYREWRSVPASLKDPLIASPLAASSLVLAGGMTEIFPNALTVHCPDGFDLYSFGPTGINQYGVAGTSNVTSYGVK